MTVDTRECRRFRHYIFCLIGFLALPPLLLAAFVVAVDPYYVFGSPSWPGFNAVKPYYEARVLVVKPHQMQRIQPDAVSLGSSRVEVGIDPRHPGWAQGSVFNFAMPSSTAYETMLAFLHAQAVGTPLKQAVVGLDFFGFNIFFPRNHDQQEIRFAGDGVRSFADYLAADLKARKPDVGQTPGGAGESKGPAFDEALYLAANADVKAAVVRKDFKSGREHYELAGRAERRLGASIPSDWDELGYLQTNPDVGYAISQGSFLNGYHHYLAAGRVERRLGGFKPEGWDEAGYLAATPSARIRIALGDFHSGYVHYAAVGHKEGLPGGFPSSGVLDRISLKWPGVNRAMFRFAELNTMIFSTTAVSDSAATIFRQSEPPSFDDKGDRVWAGQDEVMLRSGGNGQLIRNMILGWRWYLWLMPPRFMYCFTNSDTGMTMFDPYRFMLRRAYADGTDMRLFVTPLHAATRTLLGELGLGERYDYWLRELVRINDEEGARAGKRPLPLWDFSNANSVTSELIPAKGDLTPMRWYWEYSHYRRAAGDLILDRIFNYHSASRALPSDFGVLLTETNIDAHLRDSRAGLADWARDNAELASQITNAATGPNVENRQSKATCW